jgi:acyl-CoA synthetase (AMP-forming)/AMP-acid ligase II
MAPAPSPRPSPSLLTYLRARAEDTPEGRAYGDWGAHDVSAWITWGELDRRGRAIGAELQRVAATGARVLLLYPPGLEYITAFYGCLYAGAVAVPAYPPDPARLDRTLPRLQAIVADARASIVLTTRAIATMFEAVAAHVEHLASLRWIATSDLDDVSGWAPPTVDERTLAFLQYTSGSTGAPKGVRLTHGNLLHNAAQISRGTLSTPDQTIVTWLPPYHDMGLIGSIIHGLYVGCPVIQIAPAAFLMRPFRWLEAISKTRAAMSGGPNFAFDLCVQKIGRAERATLDLSSWKLAYVGAEPVRAHTLERFAETFAECGFRREALWPCYGLAEATLMVTNRQRETGYRTRFVEDGTAEVVGVGFPIADSEIRIVDPVSRVALPDGAVGEIWCRSPSVAAGYWNQPEASAEVFGARLANGEGPFLRTGDLGLLDGGELYVTGRIKEVIIVRGRKHYPSDIEDTVEKMSFGASYHRAGGCVAFAETTAAGDERVWLAVEVERRQRERRRASAMAPERRRGADRRHRPFVYRYEEPTPFDPESLVRSLRRAIAADYGVELAGVFLLRPGAIPKTSSGKKQRLLCGKQLLDGTRAADVLHAWRLDDGAQPVAPMRSSRSGRVKISDA